MISKETEAEIVRLYHGEKWPIGTIASQLGLHHTTVQRVLRQTGIDPKVVEKRKRS
jgi:IS30 family transposase